MNRKFYNNSELSAFLLNFLDSFNGDNIFENGFGKIEIIEGNIYDNAKISSNQLYSNI